MISCHILHIIDIPFTRHYQAKLQDFLLSYQNIKKMKKDSSSLLFIYLFLLLTGAFDSLKAFHLLILLLFFFSFFFPSSGLFSPEQALSVFLHYFNQTDGGTDLELLTLLGLDSSYFLAFIQNFTTGTSSAQFIFCEVLSPVIITSTFYLKCE